MNLLSPVKSSPMKPEIPNLPDWHLSYDGNSGSYREGRKLQTKYGEYHLLPVCDKTGRFVGYSLNFAHIGEGKPDKGGMWKDLGLFTHPGKAISAARSHHSSFPKKESVEEKNESSLQIRVARAILKFKK